MRRVRPALLTIALLALPGAAWARAPGDALTPERTLLEAQAAVRAGRLTEARRLYVEAAAGMPGIGDWLLRRAALLTPDSAGRAALYARITLPIVRARLLETEARARERYRDPTGAALRYDSLGRTVDAVRVRLTAATGAAERRALRQQLVEFIARRPASRELRAATDLLAQSRLELPADEALTVARAATRIGGQDARAVPLYARATAAGLATAADRLAYGISLARLGRHREAMAAWARVPSSSEAAPEAAYQRATSLVRLGLGDSALGLLRGISHGDEASATVAPKALSLMADIRLRSGDSAGARQHWLDLARRYPRHDLAARGGFLAGLILWEQGATDSAASEWERVHLASAGAEGLAAGYWSGRAYDRLGDASHARLLWQSVIARDALSYYSVASAGRLGVAPWAPVEAPDSFLVYPDFDRAGIRMTLLQGLDMGDELGWECEALLAGSGPSLERMLAAADLLRRQGQPSAAVGLARRALQAGAPADARTYRLIFPLMHPDELRRHALASGLDPNFVAALIRQESVWETAAKSRAGALGLMQVMPGTGREIARALGVTHWRPDLLLDPVTNMRFGTYYLAESLRRFEGDFGRALAAYNAGPGRIGRWAAGAAADDPELFVERITIPETRDYVRIVQRNLAVYRALYGS